MLLKTRHLDHVVCGLRDADVDERLHLKPVAVMALDGFEPRDERDGRQTGAPKRVVAVAKISELGPVDHVHQSIECRVAESPEASDVDTSPAGDEATALGEVRTVV